MSPTAATASPRTRAEQLTLLETDTPLEAVTFVVVDLETTGTSPGANHITEIGAVRTCGGQVTGEFRSFVHTSHPLTRKISALTGIYQDDVVNAPHIREVLPSFLEFAHGCVLVAHNARFDMGFLSRAAQNIGLDWPQTQSLCTVILARRILEPGETASLRLSDLARYFSAETTPTHRALDDARATVDVLHGLIDRVGNQGVSTLFDLTSYRSRIPGAVRARKSLADKLHAGPGVYIFRNSQETAIYIGSSIDVRRRVRSYYSGTDSRRRMDEMVSAAQSIESIVCHHVLEARVREARLIAALKPSYNRQSRSPRRGWWLYQCAGDQLRIGREPREISIGPFRKRTEARAAIEELEGAASLKNGANLHTQATAMSHNQMTHSQWTALSNGLDRCRLDQIVHSIDSLAAEHAFERAARLRDRVMPLLSTVARQHSLAALAELEEVTLAQEARPGSWNIAVVRFGQLAGAGVASQSSSLMESIDLVRRGATTVVPQTGPLRGSTIEELGHITRWIDAAPTRIVSTSQPWSEPIASAAGLRHWSIKAHLAKSHVEEHQ